MKLICKTDEGKDVLLTIEGTTITSIEPVFPESIIPPSLKSILSDVSSKTGISIDALKSKSRFRQIVDARCIYFRRAKEITKLSYASIGFEVNRDHATVIFGLNKAYTIREVIELYNRIFHPELNKPIIQDLNLKLPVLQKLTNPVVASTKEEFAPVKRIKGECEGFKPYMGYVSREKYLIQ